MASSDLSFRGGKHSQTHPNITTLSKPATATTLTTATATAYHHTLPHLTAPHLYHSTDRSPLEDENDNLVNEAREKEKAFIDSSQNEQYLTEDSSGFDPPPPLPLYGVGGAVRRVRVGGDDGPPMVYSVRLHAEQVLVSRILGINAETGDKMELYKCFMCGVAFPSVSRLQAHLWTHKQRFVCSKCSFSCDSRVVFSSHVQREHLSATGGGGVAGAGGRREEGPGQQQRGVVGQEDPSNAENTVTVAALLSALREKARAGGRAGQTGLGNISPAPDDETDCSSGEDSYASPGCDAGQVGAGQGQAGQDEAGHGAEEMFKMYSCRFCGKKFDRAFSCNRHERVHTGYKPCFCRVCGRGFSEPRNLRHHVIRFHSDGSLRHLIKRDRRRKGENDPSTTIQAPVSPSPPLPHTTLPQLAILPQETRLKDVLKETANKLISSSNIDISGLSGKTGLEITLTKNDAPPQSAPKVPSAPQSPSPPPSKPHPQVSIHKQEEGNTSAAAAAAAAAAVTTYTTSLTKIIAASLDNSSRGNGRRMAGLGVETGVGQGSYRGQDLEPGEIRLDGRARIIEGESGRRLVVAEDEEGMDHSPHFSNYAPRLNIVQEPIDRDKALVPITDDIGRTFFECPYCHKLFGSTSDMNRHLDFHEDLRPYNCEYCDYSARTNSQLKVHKMRHEGIKLYSCDVCNYNGVTQSDLNRHKKTQSHIARSQNICSICGLGFYTTSQKQVHIVQCHPEVEGASSLIQMSMGPPVVPLIPPHPPPPPLPADGGGGGGVVVVVVLLVLLLLLYS
ncbi:zinc finger protein 628-like isoform X2 [Portunus trituberculatus]|uniref:zinc finger protein 628-like isoform X2 n=1 Tax=Portunus trituberculatus TaxID=210409 RepID=UPI001E1CB34E|nr:zinc finger protein 628-like isoform X2 [Portunus trituberculatus]